MKKSTTIFSAIFIALITLWLTYGSKVVAELTFPTSVSIDDSGTKVILTPQEGFSTEAYLLEAQEVVTDRLNQLQPDEAYQVILHAGHIEVLLSEHENIQYIIDIIARVGQVEFIDGGDQPPLGRFVETEREESSDPTIYRTLFTGQEIKAVVAPTSGQIFYQITPDKAAVERMEEFIETYSNNGYICLVIDTQVINCSKMYYWSGETLEILPNLSSGTGLSLADLAVFLHSGPLPTSLEVLAN